MPEQNDGILSMIKKMLSGGDTPPSSENRMRSWQAANNRHNMDLPSDVRNSRANEIGDHYSVGADMGLGAGVGPAVSALQELVGRPLLSAFPDLGNELMPDTFNFKTPSNNRTGAIDPYTMPTYAESAQNFRGTVAGNLDKYPKIQKLLGLQDILDRHYGDPEKGK